MKASIAINLVWEIAAQEAIASQFGEISLEHFFMGLLKLSELNPDRVKQIVDDDSDALIINSEIAQIKQYLNDAKINSTTARRNLRNLVGKGDNPYNGEVLHRSLESRLIFENAQEIAQSENSPHLLCLHLQKAILSNPSDAIKSVLPAAFKLKKGKDTPKKPEAVPSNPDKLKLGEFVNSLNLTRDKLHSSIFGQDHAINAFIEGLFNSEVVNLADSERKAPKAIFVFAGPPGVGKTYLADLAANLLGRPFRRFDMSSYSSHQQNEGLIGISKMYQGSHPGQLTEFVDKNPNSIILFDEIEKSHSTTINLFLQVLDSGVLEDKFHEKNVAFKDTVLIFTTNAGRSLYDNPNSSGVNVANAMFHRRTILDALENEKNAATGQPYFPSAICSRMATGYPILFNHLNVSELRQVVSKEIARIGQLFELQYNKKFTYSDLLPLCLVLKEGAKSDARTLKAQAESYIKTEIFKFCQLFKTNRLDEVFEQVDKVEFITPDFDKESDVEVRSVLLFNRSPNILLISDPYFAGICKNNIKQITWHTAATAEDAIDIAANEDLDLILLDIWLGNDPSLITLQSIRFDHTPIASRGLEKGQEVLYKLRDRVPNIPLYLLSINESDKKDEDIDHELLLACVRGGGSRGIITFNLGNLAADTFEAQIDGIYKKLYELTKQLYLEKMTHKLSLEHKVLDFVTVPQVSKKAKNITLTMHNFRFKRAISAQDAGELLDEVERPRTRFEDVIGAESAKEELRFFIEYLSNPQRFRALGLKPPKGVLLYGPPGTGKTMLARAMAGESNVAFISITATNFVTVWQGSGPQNIRDLFARARRYAPVIVFIDEIDAIGKVRSGGSVNKAEENTLNAFLAEMDGFTSISSDRPVFILAATNYDIQHQGRSNDNRILDEALVRRFSRTILVDLPELKARTQYLIQRLSIRASCSVTPEIINLIAERSVGMSIANLEQIIETAARIAIKQDSILTDHILEEAFESTLYGNQQQGTKDDVLRTARHEAGHTLMYWKSGWWPTYVTIISRGNHGGYMAPDANELENRGVRSQDSLLADIRVALAGRAAELLYYGEIGGLTSGVSSDLEYATGIARNMICRYGMSEELGLIALPELLRNENAINSPYFVTINEYASQILHEEMSKTSEFMHANQKLLDDLVTALMKSERLTKAELQTILPPIIEKSHN